MISDYQIIQRNDEGFANLEIDGVLPKDFVSGQKIACRVVREIDNMNIVNWQLCDVDNGKWFNTLKIPEGGLYRLEVARSEEENPTEWYTKRGIKLVRHFGVGDIYILAGQSNMSGYGRDVAYDPPTLGVHLFGNNGKWTIAAHPFADSTDTIYPENEEYTSATSPSLSFARTLKEALNIPIGLVHTALGGSNMGQWDSDRSGELYKGMLRRLEEVGNIKGVLWYQGCAETMLEPELAENFFTDFSNMVKNWRKEIGNVPFVTVQLNRWNTYDAETFDRRWGMVRDAQRRAALELENVYLVTSTDLGVSDGIHNCAFSNVVVGERMARTVLSQLYGKPGQLAPFILSADFIDDTHIRVNIGGGTEVQAMDNSGIGFDVEDQTGIIPCSSAEPDFKNNALILTTTRNFASPAKLHAIWRAVPPQFVPKSVNGMPLVSCYGLDIK